MPYTGRVEGAPYAGKPELRPTPAKLELCPAEGEETSGAARAPRPLSHLP
jgi:hypothetical protein